MIDWLNWAPYIVVAGIVAFALFVIFNYVRVKKLPPVPSEHETELGSFRIVVVSCSGSSDVFDGDLYTFKTFFKEAKVRAWEKGLDEKYVKKIGKCLETAKKVYCYAMRQGTKKLAFISFGTALEVTFTAQEGRKFVVAQQLAPKVNGDFEYLPIVPIDQTRWEVSSNVYKEISEYSETAKILREKTPLAEELQAEKEENRVLKAKMTGFADEIGDLRDEAEYWKFEAKRREAQEKSEEGFRVPRIIRQGIPFGILAVAGYLISSMIPQVTQYSPYSPFLVAIILPGICYAIKKAIHK